MQIHTRISAANLKVPKARPAPSPVPEPGSPAETKLLFERLSRLQAACGTNKNDTAIALITACISEGVNTRPGIIGVLTQLGFVRGHAATMLNKNEGNSSVAHRWCRGADGIYTLLS